MHQLLIFDFDGTLADTRLDLANAVNNTRKDYGLPELSSSEIVSFIGNGRTKLIERSFHDKADVNVSEASDIFSKLYGQNLTEKTKLYPEVYEVLETLSKAKNYMSVLSNKPGNFTRTLTEYFELDPFLFSVIGGGDLSSVKPDPEGIFETVRRAKKAGFVRNEKNIWMIGDHYTDLEAGKKAGVKTILCTYGFGNARDIIPDYRISSFREILDLIKTESY